MTDGRNVFTPFRSTRSNTRLMLHLSDADKAKVNQRGEWGPERVTDLDSGAVLRVRGADCGLGRCFCAAEVTRVVTPGHRQPAVLEESAAPSSDA